MPPARKHLGPDCEELSNGMVLCNVCRDGKHGSNVKVIQRHSWSKHCSSDEHQQALRTQDSRKLAAEETRKRYDEAYCAPAASLNHCIDPPVMTPIPTISSGLSHADREYLHASLINFTPEEQAHYFAPVDQSAVQKHNEEVLQQEFDLLSLYAHEEMLDESPEDATVPDWAAEFQSLGLDEEGNEEEMHQFLTGVSMHQDYQPYTNKTTFLLDVLDNLPRLRLSSNHLKMILWIMRNSDPKDVPSYKALRDEQAKLRNLCGIPSIQYKSEQGDIYYLNDVVNMMKKNFENPETAQHIMYHPEDTDGAPCSEFTQFARLRENPEQLTPSF
ncbi:hypothetical protein GGU11DRAFT_749747 [Lentinula aff. detonsa]|nr:hypothetical protein GGU11DRAFT_749747 [Lentinula aff. detonsa]